MKVKPLKHKDIVKLAAHELNQGSKLNKVEKDLHEIGIERTEALKAIEEADYYKKQEDLKAKQEAESKEQKTQAKAGENAPQSKEKSSFWFWIMVTAVAGIVLYLFFSGIINPMELIKNFK